MRKVSVLLIALLMILPLAACSAEKAESPQDSQQTSSNEDASSEQSSNQSNSNNQSGQVESFDEDIPIPKGYPENLVPIMDGSRVFSGGNENQPNGKASVWVKILSPEEPEEVAAFYRNVLSGAGQKKDEMFAGICYLEGILEGIEIRIKITEEVYYDGFPTTTFIEITGLDSIDDKEAASTIDTGAANTGLINEDKIPGGYRKDLVPIVGGSEIYSSDEMEYNGNTAYVIVYYSVEKKEDVLEFYKEVLKDAADKEEGAFSTSSYYLNGTLDNVKVSLIIGDEDVHEEYSSFCNLTMEMLE